MGRRVYVSFVFGSLRIVPDKIASWRRREDVFAFVFLEKSESVANRRNWLSVAHGRFLTHEGESVSKVHVSTGFRHLSFFPGVRLLSPEGVEVFPLTCYPSQVDCFPHEITNK